MSKVLKREIVAVLAIIAALVSTIFVPPDSEYINYLDAKTLIGLFCIMASVSALNNTGFILSIASRIVS